MEKNDDIITINRNELMDVTQFHIASDRRELVRIRPPGDVIIADDITLDETLQVISIMAKAIRGRNYDR